MALAVAHPDLVEVRHILLILDLVSLALSLQPDLLSIQRKSYGAWTIAKLTPMLKYHQQIPHGHPWNEQSAIQMVR
jgi:hypothetical protein